MREKFRKFVNYTMLFVWCLIAPLELVNADPDDGLRNISTQIGNEAETVKDTILVLGTLTIIVSGIITRNLVTLGVGIGVLFGGNMIFNHFKSKLPSSNGGI